MVAYFSPMQKFYHELMQEYTLRHVYSVNKDARRPSELFLFSTIRTSIEYSMQNEANIIPGKLPKNEIHLKLNKKTALYI